LYFAINFLRPNTTGTVRRDVDRSREKPLVMVLGTAKGKAEVNNERYFQVDEDKCEIKAYSDAVNFVMELGTKHADAICDMTFANGLKTSIFARAMNVIEPPIKTIGSSTLNAAANTYGPLELLMNAAAQVGDLPEGDSKADEEDEKHPAV
jgi:hypothetical protein